MTISAKLQNNLLHTLDNPVFCYKLFSINNASPTQTGSKTMLDFEAALISPAYAYSRAKPIGGSLSVLVYHYDAKSPSGVLLASSHPDFETAIAIMDRVGRPFPLSPTEKAQ